MVSVPDTKAAPPVATALTLTWRGRSGRVYPLTPIRLDSFFFEAGWLYVLARGTLVLWAGSSAEVVEDAESRARFRLALTCADRAFKLSSGDDGVERMTLLWDLEGAAPAVEPGLNAA